MCKEQNYCHSLAQMWGTGGRRGRRHGRVIKKNIKGRSQKFFWGREEAYNCAFILNRMHMNCGLVLLSNIFISSRINTISGPSRNQGGRRDTPPPPPEFKIARHTVVGKSMDFMESTEKHYLLRTFSHVVSLKQPATQPPKPQL